MKSNNKAALLSGFFLEKRADSKLKFKIDVSHTNDNFNQYQQFNYRLFEQSLLLSIIAMILHNNLYTI